MLVIYHAESTLRNPAYGKPKPMPFKAPSKAVGKRSKGKGSLGKVWPLVR
jgi:hypothetical protein